MAEAVIKFGVVPDIKEYVTIKQAAEDERVPYTQHWLWQLIKREKIEAIKVGEGYRAVWLIHLPSLLAYIEEMDELGSQKHARTT